MKLIMDKQDLLDQAEVEKDAAAQEVEQKQVVSTKRQRVDSAPQETKTDKSGEKSSQKSIQESKQQLIPIVNEQSQSQQSPQQVLSAEQQRLVHDILLLHSVHEQLKWKKRELKALEKQREDLKKRFPAFNEDPLTSD